MTDDDNSAESPLQKLQTTAISEVMASPEERIQARNERLAKLRDRSGLSMDDLAKAMGFKGQSSIQRYLRPDYDRGFRPELAARFKAALVGRGNPPITPSELNILDNWAETPDGQTLDLVKMLVANFEAGGTTEEYRRQLAALGLPERNHISSTLSLMRHSKSLGMDEHHLLAGLPLDEGDVVLKMPKQLSEESAATLRNWLSHLVKLALRAGSK